MFQKINNGSNDNNDTSPIQMKFNRKKNKTERQEQLKTTTLLKKTLLQLHWVH